MIQWKWLRYAIMTGAIALVTSGCSILGSGGNDAIDPPPGTDAQTATTQPVTIDMAAQKLSQMTVYVKDAKGFVAPVSINMPQTLSVARSALEYMVAGGPVSGLLPGGFSALLPKGTLVKGINIVQDQKLAIVDFSKEFNNYEEKDERKLLEAVVWTMTGFPTVEKVQLWVEGTPLTEMPKGKTPLDEPLGRAIGINIEKSGNVDFGQSSPVTLYFLNQNDENYKYYVPVTRMVKRTDNIARAVVNELIKGPDPNRGLAAVLNATTEVKAVKETEGLITVDFSEKLLGADKKASADGLQSIILSLTENTGASKVQIMVNGDVKVTSTDEHSYSRPVSRPVHLNPANM